MCITHECTSVPILLLSTQNAHKFIQLNYDTTQIASYFTKKHVSKEHFQILTGGLLYFVSEDICHFAALEGYGFMKLVCHTLVNVQMIMLIQ